MLKNILNFLILSLIVISPTVVSAAGCTVPDGDDFVTNCNCIGGVGIETTYTGCSYTVNQDTCFVTPDCSNGGSGVYQGSCTDCGTSCVNKECEK